tara:strand:+ start:900 stop:1073 length:174 start_codon:yes stop_codon:yes gene_type:complete
MGTQVVEGTGLENRQGATPRGFESHPIRHQSIPSIDSSSIEALSASCGRADVARARI